ncbi:hypothetical protein IGI04_001917 [Brassica rapa subsp. trilocularis]|uniref:Uncharacterized protein n=1 Tax=Brassica rapa subsp. trilocularis TaxID=1813537 RepID=A0ABQ7NU19_BRACM|nr:hypothetical protein IGI04_001917 [Brassica rapa subsp. trilocularis]
MKFSINENEKRGEQVLICYIRRDVPSKKARTQRIERERCFLGVLLVGVEGHSEALSDGVRCGLILVALELALCVVELAIVYSLCGFCVCFSDQAFWCHWCVLGADGELSKGGFIEEICEDCSCRRQCAPGRLKMQPAAMICISSRSTTGGTTSVCHEDEAKCEFGFRDVCGLAELEKERSYVLEDIWTFSIKQKGVCLKIKFSINENGKRGEQVLICYIRRDVPSEKAMPQRIEREMFSWCVTAWCRRTF